MQIRHNHPKYKDSDNTSGNRGESGVSREGVLVGLLAVALTAVVFGHEVQQRNDQTDKGEDKEDAVLAEIEQSGEGVEVHNGVLRLNAGVNLRKHPYISKDGSGSLDKSTQNIAHTLSSPIEITNPLSVRVSAVGQNGNVVNVSYYLVPSGDEPFRGDDGELNPSAFNWVDGRVLHQASGSGDRYAEFIDSDEQHDVQPDGQVIVTDEGIYYSNGTANQVPVSVLREVNES
ncbi:hypothetical protein KC973_04060 [Candidatus Saccharibacteria bacterium]|nr:hypothetical protein [Candidatus Saccharibacteria bacterium]